MSFVTPDSLSSMTLLFDVEFNSPAENLACDEALLDYCEEMSTSPFLRFWESTTHFVVLGYAKQRELEVYGEQCRALGIPVLRRCSGGGTVLQGPGCLNYTIVLPAETTPELQTIAGANRYIMARNCSAISKLLELPVTVEGHTDLVIEGRKFSGNAQRRKRHSLLFHGSVLLNFNLGLIEQTLRPPAQQPAYRAQRGHDDFVRNLGVSSSEVQAALMQEWQMTEGLSRASQDAVVALTRELVASKYGQSSWNDRF